MSSVLVDQIESIPSPTVCKLLNKQYRSNNSQLPPGIAGFPLRE